MVGFSKEMREKSVCGGGTVQPSPELLTSESTSVDLLRWNFGKKFQFGYNDNFSRGLCSEHNLTWIQSRDVFMIRGTLLRQAKSNGWKYLSASMNPPGHGKAGEEDLGERGRRRERGRKGYWEYTHTVRLQLRNSGFFPASFLSLSLSLSLN